ncbi:hypothetical protein Ahy_A10g048945 isoform A [Arachis hypogaea]|uniref:Uncharacterized protein n=1 Tax=Arachis hypogaea TaxID=3818 RepID=A0A445B693_ARAHY|nr:hypothetical protein Ahy_A10g048945 isoform A [Arachis hypogaea]
MVQGVIGLSERKDCWEIRRYNGKHTSTQWTKLTIGWNYQLWYVLDVAVVPVCMVPTTHMPAIAVAVGCRPVPKTAGHMPDPETAAHMPASDSGAHMPEPS